MRSAANTPLLSNSISSIPLWVIAVNMNEFIKKTVRQHRSGHTRVTDMMLHNGDKRQCFAVKNSLLDSGNHSQTSRIFSPAW